MKKKIFSLLLVVSLMMAFTVTSFAYHSEYDSFNIHHMEYEDIFILAKDMDSNDDKLDLTIVIDDQDAPYMIEVFDLTAHELVYSNIFTGNMSEETIFRHINHKHSYKIKIINRSPDPIRGYIEVEVF